MGATFDRILGRPRTSDAKLVLGESDLASQAAAEAGTNNTKWLSPLRLWQALAGATAKVLNGAVTLGGNLTVQGNFIHGDSASDEFSTTDDDPQLTNVTAASVEAGGAKTALNREAGDARYGMPAGQTVSISGNVRFQSGTTGGRRFFGTVANLTNGTETKLFNAASLGNALVGRLFVALSQSNGVGNVAADIFFRGNQGAFVMQQSPSSVFAVAPGNYWISFASPLTVATGDLITGNSTGATARAWRGSGLPGTVSDVWLYDVTGIFTSADTNLSINGTPSGVGLSNSVFGANPSTGLLYFFYVSRLSDGTPVPAIYHRQGNTLSVLIDYTGL